MPDETPDRWRQARDVIADMKRVGGVPDSTRPDGVVTTPEFSGHKSIYLANLEGFLGGRFPALLKERDQLFDALRLMAAARDASLFADPEHDVDDLFDRGLLCTLTDTREPDVSRAALTLKGREFIQEALNA